MNKIYEYVCEINLNFKEKKIYEYIYELNILYKEGIKTLEKLSEIKIETATNTERIYKVYIKKNRQNYNNL